MRLNIRCAALKCALRETVTIMGGILNFKSKKYATQYNDRIYQK